MKPNPFLSALVLSFVFSALLLFHEDPVLVRPIKVAGIGGETIIEDILRKYSAQLGNHADIYHGHVYRVLTYARHFLGEVDVKLDDLLLKTAAFHNLGVWVQVAENSTYIEDACILLHHDLADREEEKSLMCDALHGMAHLGSPSPDDPPLRRALVQATRLDLSIGIWTSGMPRDHINLVRATVPEKGFHLALLASGIHALASSGGRQRLLRSLRHMTWLHRRED